MSFFYSLSCSSPYFFVCPALHENCCLDFASSCFSSLALVMKCSFSLLVATSTAPHVHTHDVTCCKSQQARHNVLACCARVASCHFTHRRVIGASPLSPCAPLSSSPPRWLSHPPSSTSSSWVYVCSVHPPVAAPPPHSRPPLHFAQDWGGVPDAPYTTVAQLNVRPPPDPAHTPSYDKVTPLCRWLPRCPRASTTTARRSLSSLATTFVRHLQCPHPPLPARSLRVCMCVCR